MRTIPLTRGYVTVVDDVDYDRLHLGLNSWSVIIGRSGHTYANRGASTAEQAAGFPPTVLLHRLICGVATNASWHVDHKNHDSLDNRCENLRLCTIQQNNANQRRTRGRSIYKGVQWDSRESKWRATIGFNGRTKHLGYFDDERIAAVQYDWIALEVYGEFAHLNLPLAH